MDNTKDTGTEQTIQIGSGQTKRFNKKKTVLIAALVVVLALAGAGGVAVYQKKQQDKRDRDAIVAFEKNRFNETQNAINLLLIKSDYKGVISKADSYIQNGTIKENIIKMKTTKARAYKSLGDTTAALNTYKDAEKDADAIGDKTNYTIHHGLGIIYLQMGDKKKALQEYEKVLKGLNDNKKDNNMEISTFKEEVRVLREEVKQ